MSAVPAVRPARTPAKRKARQLAKYLRAEHPDYAYLKAVFRALREELAIEVEREPKKLPYVPSEAEIRRYYQVVWQARRSSDIVLIKTLLYTAWVPQIVAWPSEKHHLDQFKPEIVRYARVTRR